MLDLSRSPRPRPVYNAGLHYIKHCELLLPGDTVTFTATGMNEYVFATGSSGQGYLHRESDSGDLPMPIIGNPMAAVLVKGIVLCLNSHKAF